MDTDKIKNEEDAGLFLKGLGLRVKGDVVLQVVRILEEKTGSLFSLYTSGIRRDGNFRTPISGKGTIYKVKRLYEEGKLDPYLEYVRFEKANVIGVERMIEDLGRIRINSLIEIDILKLLDDWIIELPLPLNYLDNEDLSIGASGVPHQVSDLRIKWIHSEGRTIRKFLIEEQNLFQKLRQVTQANSKIWRNFELSRKLGGEIITGCSLLTKQIIEQARSETRLDIAHIPDTRATGEGLDRLFIWTIYAEALQILSAMRNDHTYTHIDNGNNMVTVFWGRIRIAVVLDDSNDVNPVKLE